MKSLDLLIDVNTNNVAFMLMWRIFHAFIGHNAMHYREVLNYCFFRLLELAEDILDSLATVNVQLSNLRTYGSQTLAEP